MDKFQQNRAGKRKQINNIRNERCYHYWSYIGNNMESLD